MKRWFFLLLIFNTCAFGQKKLRRDSLYIQPRSFSSPAITSFKNNKDFQYTETREPAPSLWDKFWSWVWWKIGQVLSTKGGRTTIWSILIILGIAIVVYFIINVTGMNREGLFGRGNKGLQKYSVSQNDIHNISFDDEIERAINNGNYRLAARLQYLQALKKLSDKGYIEWRINKTNTDYLTETKGKSFNAMFVSLTHDFEYIWYGEKQVSKEQFFEIRDQFQQFNKLV